MISGLQRGVRWAPGAREAQGGESVSPVPDSVWEEVLASAPGALPTQTPAWLRCVCAVDGYEDASQLFGAPDGRRLILPLVRRRRIGGGLGRALGPALDTVAGLPDGWGVGGLLAEGGTVAADQVRLATTAVIDGRALGGRALRVVLRPDPATAAAWDAGMPPWVARQPRMAHTVPLDGGFGDVWRGRFRGDTRTRVRRAERAGVVVEHDDTGRLVPLFHDLYAKSVVRWAKRDGVPPVLARSLAARREPERKLRTVAAMLGAACRVYAAFHDGRPVAAIVVLYAGRTAAYWRGAMDDALAGPSYANYLLHRTAIEDAAEAGCGAYHMGESAPGSALALFKSRFGAIEQHYSAFRIERMPLGSAADRIGDAAGWILRLRKGRD